MNYLKLTSYLVLIAIFSLACEVNSEKFPVDIKELQQPENTGGFLRVVQTEGATWNLLDIGSQEFTVTLEADDAQNGGQLESVSFFVGFQDNAANNVGNIAVSTDPIRTIPASEFSIDENSGLPRVTTSFTSSQLLEALGLSEDQVGINSAILLRWSLTLTNGKTFTNTSAGLNITGGAFYNSPFAQNIVQSLEIPENLFTGSYTFTQDGPGGVLGLTGSGDGWLFGDDATGTVTLSIDPNNQLNGRVFTTNEGGYLNEFGFGTAISPIQFALTIDPITNRNFTTLTGQFGTGLLCSTGILLGAPAEVSLEGTWDGSDDSQFTLTIVEDVTNDCGGGTFPFTFTFVKN